MVRKKQIKHKNKLCALEKDNESVSNSIEEREQCFLKRTEIHLLFLFCFLIHQVIGK